MRKFTTLSLALSFILAVGCSDSPTAVSAPDDDLTALTAPAAASFEDAETEIIYKLVEVEIQDGRKICFLHAPSLVKAISFSIPEDQECPRIPPLKRF